jgi:hypothetical protein
VHDHFFNEDAGLIAWSDRSLDMTLDIWNTGTRCVVMS